MPRPTEDDAKDLITWDLNIDSSPAIEGNRGSRGGLQLMNRSPTPERYGV